MDAGVLSSAAYTRSDMPSSNPGDMMSRGRPKSVTAARRRRVSAATTTTPVTQSIIISPLSDNFPTPRASDFPQIPTTIKHVAAPRKPSLRLQTEYDDLYDISEDESEQRDVVPEIQFDSITSRRSSSAYSPSPRSSPQIRSSWSSAGSGNRKSLSLQIPSIQRKAAPVVPTPPPKVPLPSLLSFLAQDAPSSTAPPSLDGSLTSEQLANMETPPTPSTSMGGNDASQWGHPERSPYNGSTEHESEPWQGVIQLDPEALATLQIFSESPEDVAPAEPSAEPHREMSQIIELPKRRKSMAPKTPATPYSLTDFDIPSPTLFFSSLGPATRSTWAPAATENVPTSATAEHFYIPSISARVETPVDQGIPSSRNTISEVTSIIRQPEEERSASPDVVTEIEEVEATAEYDKDYETNLAAGAALNFDRTSLWLQQQEGFSIPRKAVAESPASPSVISTPALSSASPNPNLPSSAPTVPPPPPPVRASTAPPKITIEQAKQAVRISTASSMKNEKGEWVATEKKDPIFLRAFQHAQETTDYKDAFIHAQQRLDTLQLRRLCSRDVHKDRLDGVFKPFIRNVADDASDEAKMMAKVEKERHALKQVDEATWNVAATKILNGGSLLSRPAARRLSRYSRLGAEDSRGRILDLGGQPVCDWGWACASEHPNAKVYTVIEKAARHPTTTSIRGPSNHRVISVPKLWRLPFADSHFDVISARSLHALLRADIPHGEWDDEYELCLKECMRCLKPGGYLDFNVLDADMMRAGPQGSSMSAEFAYGLKARGYDPYATRVFLGRLRKAGFGAIKRSWMFLPAGPSAAATTTTEAAEKSDDEDGVVTASTRDAAALTGLVGGLAWERWMLRLQAETEKRDDEMFGKVRTALIEGAEKGAGWRCLNGFARKPLHS